MVYRAEAAGDNTGIEAAIATRCEVLDVRTMRNECGSLKGSRRRTSPVTNRVWSAGDNPGGDGRRPASDPRLSTRPCAGKVAGTQYGPECLPQDGRTLAPVVRDANQVMAESKAVNRCPRQYLRPGIASSGLLAQAVSTWSSSGAERNDNCMPALQLAGHNPHL
jgi:hypothetical protein